MKAIVTGELIINGEFKLVFAGRPLTSAIYVGAGENWQKLKHVKGFLIRGAFPYNEGFTLELELAALVTEGELLAEKVQLPKPGSLKNFP